LIRGQALRLYRWLRIRLPQPWSSWLARLVYLPKLVAGHEQTRRALAEEVLIERLVSTRAPLQPVGVGLSERVVEIPWVLSQLTADMRTVLDVGTAFAPEVYKRLLVRQAQAVDTVDLVATEIPGIQSHRADLRELPFAADTFDCAICLSTLEHIGMDNRQYDIESDQASTDDDAVALRELGRVARVVLVTVPAGADADMGWQRQYSPTTFAALVERAGLAVERLDVFSHDSVAGWEGASAQTVVRRTYGEGAVAAAAVICAALKAR
jgi:hypothetical protein